jgi:hypothetical protein
MFVSGDSTDEDDTVQIDGSADPSLFTTGSSDAEPTLSSPPSFQHTNSLPPAISNIADHAALTTDHQVPNHTNSVLDEWPSWSANHRLTALRRWMLDMEWNWGSIASWSAKCAEEWATVKERDKDHVSGWLDEETKKVVEGRRMLGDLGRIMEGKLPTDKEVLRDIYLQGYQLTCALDSGVVGLEQTLSRVRSEILVHDICGCGKATCVA